MDKLWSLKLVRFEVVFVIGSNFYHLSFIGEGPRLLLSAKFQARKSVQAEFGEEQELETTEERK